MTLCRWLGLACLALAGTGCSKPSVVRSAGGETYVGRFIGARAYEAYARGALFEAEGKTDAAISAFREAAELDADGPEPWTRLGALLCDRDLDAASSAFDHGKSADPSFGPLRREIARCHLRAGRKAEALREAELAAILDPDDEESALTLVDALEANGKHVEALRLLVAHHVAGAPSAVLRERLRARAAKSNDRALERLAREPAARGASFPPRDKPTLAAVDGALLEGDLGGARKLALRVKLTPGDLALRAAALGRFDLALEQGTLVFDADPESQSAWLAVLASRHLRASQLDPAADLAGHVGSSRPLTRLERLVLAEALARAAGSESARQVLGADDLSEGTSAAEKKAVARLRSWLDHR